MANPKSKNRIKMEEQFGLLSELEWLLFSEGFRAIVLHPEWLENQSYVKQYFEELLIGFRSLTTREQVQLVDSIASTIDGQYIEVKEVKE